MTKWSVIISRLRKLEKLNKLKKDYLLQYPEDTFIEDIEWRVDYFLEDIIILLQKRNGRRLEEVVSSEFFGMELRYVDSSGSI